MNSLFDIAFFEYEYVRKEAFWLFLLIPGIIFWYLYRESNVFKNINVPSLNNFEKKKFNWTAFFRHLNLFVFILGLSFVILALARPHLPEDIDEYRKKNFEGIDIVMSLDISASMLTDDVKPNRLEAAKDVAIDFIKDRPADRIGLVVYEGEAYTQAPLTNDHDLLIDLFEDVKTNMMVSGTAIGLGLITAVNRLSESDAKSKVIILLTDGQNNMGDIEPMTAAQVAKEMEVCIYTIGVGKKPENRSNDGFFDFFTNAAGEDVDEGLLTEIAEMTGGKYFRAENRTQLESIYDEIDRMEKSKVKTLEYKQSPPEKYYGILFLGLLLILCYKTINHTLLKSIP